LDKVSDNRSQGQGCSVQFQASALCHVDTGGILNGIETTHPGADAGRHVIRILLLEVG